MLAGLGLLQGLRTFRILRKVCDVSIRVDRCKVVVVVRDVGCKKRDSVVDCLN
jgi:hypothetical protein